MLETLHVAMRWAADTGGKVEDEGPHSLTSVLQPQSALATRYDDAPGFLPCFHPIYSVRSRLVHSFVIFSPPKMIVILSQASPLWDLELFISQPAWPSRIVPKTRSLDVLYS